ncbi:MAG: thiamine pyrophosphate-binding protein [Bacillota bacterium]|nr:thiamine pyrophosphate-binding protein [Bacillota bacterium]
MARINGGHLAVKYLKEVEDVEIVFGISGGHIESLLDGFTEYGIRTIDVRHEQAAVMAAEAWSIYTGKTGVCFLTAGPGFTNGLTGIVNASLDNTPLVILSGRHALRDELKGALQEMNQIDMIKPVTKWCATCYDAKRIPEYLSIAFRKAKEGRPGPVFLELPPDVLNISVDESEAPFPPRPDGRYIVRPDKNSLAKAAEMINSAKQPLFIGGSGVGFSSCSPVLKKFIEQSGIPFMLLNYGRGELADDHPQSIWDCGYIGMMSATPQADVIIAAGIRFNWLLQSGNLIPPSAKVIRIDIEASELDRNRSADVGLMGDIAATLEELIPLTEKKDHTAWLQSIRESSQAMLDYELQMRSSPSDPIHPVRLAAKIQEYAGKDAYYIADGGDTVYFGLTGFMSKLKAGVIGSAAGLFGCLGTGIPFAMAAKLANPDKKVLLLNGDGSFGFNAMEFDTMVRHNIPIVCIINNDCAWGMIKHGQEMSIGADRLQCAELGLRRYEKVVEGLGGHGEYVTEDAEIIPAIERAFASGKPAVVNVVTDPTVTSLITPFFSQSLKME